MKKFGAFLLTVLAIFTCFIFSACKSKYDNLTMTFTTVDGETLNDIDLTLDEGNPNAPSQIKIAVKVDGVSVEDVGLIEVESEPSDLVNVIEGHYNQNIYYVTVTALASCSETAKLKATHLASNKSVEIPLTIGEKAKNVTMNDAYLVAIPENEKNVYLSAEEFCTLDPIGSTDEIYFGCEQTAPAGVEFITNELGIIGFKVSPSVANLPIANRIVSLYPILVHKGYETDKEQFKSQKVKIAFVKDLNDDAVELSTDSYHKESLEGNKTFVLLSNGTSAITVPNEDAYSLSTLNVCVDLTNGTGASTRIVNSEYMQGIPSLSQQNSGYYKFNFVYDAEYLDVTQVDEKTIVRAKKYFEKELEVKIQLVPLYEGELSTVERTIKVKCDIAPSKLIVSMNGEQIDPSEPHNLFDTYGNSALGTTFTFNCIEEFAYADLRDTHILLAPEVFNAIYDEYNTEGQLIKKGNIIGNIPADIKAGTRTNKYVLQFYMNKEDANKNLMFTYDEELEKYVSETIAPNKEIYIKYVETDKSGNVDLTCNVANYYKGNLEYLKHINSEELLSATLNFKMKNGVTAMNVEAGSLVYDQQEKKATVSYIVEEYQEGGERYSRPRYIANDGAIYINRDQGIDKDSAPAYVFALRKDALIDAKGDAIETAELYVKVEGGKNNPITIKQYDASHDTTAKSKEGTASEIIYSYINQTTLVDNAIFFAFDSTTDLGEYIITLTSENGYTHTIKCWVYEELTAEDISFTLEESETCFANKDKSNSGNAFAGYDCNYIASAGTSTNLVARISEYFSAREFRFVISQDETKTESNSYIKVLSDAEGEITSGNAEIQFLNGTYYDGRNNYEKVYIGVKDKKYSDILTEAGDQWVYVELTFFIYKPVHQSDLVLHLDNAGLTDPVIRYMSNYLGIYYGDLSKALLSLEMDEDLWNYTQDQIQLEDYKIGIPSTVKAIWKTSVPAGSENPITTNSQSNNTIALTFNKSSETIYSIYAYVKQFNTVYTRRCDIEVKQPVLSTDVAVTSVVSTTSEKTFKIKTDEKGSPVLSLKAGNQCQIVGTTFSQTGEKVTNNDIAVVVVDGNGNRVSDSLVEVDYKNNTLKVADTLTGYTPDNELYILVFAKDVLTREIDDSRWNFANPSSWLIDVGYNGLGTEVQGKYAHAYQKISLKLADGLTNPYNIYDLEDLLEIDGSNKKFIIHTSIDLKGTETFDNFTGSLTTSEIIEGTGEYETVTISGVKLTGTHKNLFTNFAGTIKNIKFVVDYDVDLEATGNDEYIGVFDVNNGTLENVSVEYLGEINITGLGTAYIGGLVAENNGAISYTKQINGANGIIKISGDAVTKFGGLVGYNAKDKSIKGYYEQSTESTSTPTFVTHIETADAISSVKVDAKDLTNENSAVGGVIGFNMGKISSAFVNAEIEGKYNLGGLIGENGNKDTAISVNVHRTSNIANKVTVNNKVTEIEKITSHAKVKGTSNVGGLVGKDFFGYYSECKYQIYATDGTNLTAETNVGGLIGYSYNGFVEYSSTYSYKTSYSSASLVGNVDIYAGTSYAGGLVGYAERVSQHDGDETQNVDSPVITLSSANAYVKSAGNVGGLTCIGGQSIYIQSIYIIDAAFIGKLEGQSLDEKYFADNNKYEAYNVYAVDEANTEDPEISAHNSFNDQVIKDPTDVPEHWAYTESLNGGYIYIEKDNKPIFEIVPTSVSVTPRGDVEMFDGCVVLKYFDFKEDNPNNKTYNKHQILEIVEITYTPDDCDARFIVESNNPSIVAISGGEFVVKGVGRTTITIKSALNQTVFDTFEIVVVPPINDEGMTLEIINQDTDQDVDDNTPVNIAKNNSKEFYVTAFGHKDGWEYKTNIDSLLINVSAIDETGAEDTTFEVDSYINLNGTKFDKESYVRINSSSFTISVLQTLPEKYKMLKFVVVPSYFDSSLGKYYDSTKSSIFYITTSEDPTDLALDYNSVVLYPTNETYLRAIVTTDKLLDKDSCTSLIKAVLKDGVDVGEYKDYIGVFDIGTLVKGKQIVTYVIKYNENLEIDKKANITITIKAGDKSASAYYTYLPQRINKFEIKNYVFGEEELVDVIKQDKPGLLVIDVVPSNGYYDYLVVEDITGDEEITFTQVDKNGEPTPIMDEKTADGKGIIIRRENVVATDKDRIYVKTLIDKDATTQMHTIRVKAYVYCENNDALVGQSTKYIQAKMLPRFEKVNFVKPNGEAVKLNDGDLLTPYYVANGVNAEFEISTLNANSGVEFDMSISKDVDVNDYVEIVSGRNNRYTLRFKQGYVEELTGKTLTIVLKATQTWPNGDFDQVEKTLTLNIAEFVVHGAHLTKTQTIGGTDYLYGYRGNKIKSQFYFDDLDISYHLNNGVGYTVDTKSAPQEIINILTALNNSTSSFDFIVEGLSVEKLLGNLVFSYDEVEEDETDEAFTVEFELQYNENDGVWTYVETGSGKFITCNSTYGLMLTQQTSEEEYLLINSQDDFNKMVPDQNYVLGQDIVLKSYTPLDIQLKQFNGNGHKITIEGFNTAEFVESEVKIGLFKEVYEGMLIRNLEVCYKLGNTERTETGFNTRYEDLLPLTEDLLPLNGTEHTSVDFGGITPTNNGIITNCKVSGIVAIKASEVEKSATDLSINFNIGAVVGTNGATGYITNSESRAKIIAKANISGFVYRNEGKIVSCRYDASTGNGLIYAYNEPISYKYEVKVAGFVVNNVSSGDISMSYVTAGVTTYVQANKIGNIASKNLSAGFVYANSGKVYDCYVDVETVGGNSQNNFAGMLLENLGTVERCYTYINKGVKTNIIDLFAPSGTTGVVDCYEIKQSMDDTYKSGIKGLTTISSANRFIQSQYSAFGFGSLETDSDSAVWTMKANSLPKIVSASEEIFAFEVDANGNNLDIQGLEEIKEEIKDDAGNIIGYRYTYKLQEGNYGESSNPIIIYNIGTWDTYLAGADTTAKYYRLVADIDFSSLYANPSTSTIVFEGNLQGNNMKITGVTLSSPNEGDAIGLFKQLSGIDDPSVVNAVRNLSVSATLVNAVKTQAVGILAGIIEDFNLYNVSVTSNSILLGANAVGGLSGIVRGRFNIEHVSTNASVRSISENASASYVPYVSINNNVQESAMLNKNHYAGSLIGVLDGYIKTSSAFDINNKESRTAVGFVKDVKIASGLTIIADTAGYAFGFVGERVSVSDITINVASATISAQIYAGGLVGENRGTITNCTVIITSDSTFNSSQNIIGGIAGLNIGGDINNCTVVLNIYKDSDCTVGGVVGHNFAGTVADCTVGGYIDEKKENYYGKFSGEYVGLIVGGDYTLQDMLNFKYGYGAFDSTINASSIIPTWEVTNRVSNCTVNKGTIEYVTNNLSSYYKYVNTTTYDGNYQLAKYKVLGLIIGLTKQENDYYKFTTTIDADGNFVFNCGEYDDARYTLENVKLNEFINIETHEPVTYTLTNVYVAEYQTDLSILTFLVGAKADNIDSWSRTDYVDSARLVFYDVEGNNIKYHLTFSIDEESEYIGVNTNNIYLFDATATLPTPTMSNLGSLKEFIGWYLTEDCSGDPISTTSGIPESAGTELTLYGKFEVVYYVTLYLNGEIRQETTAYFLDTDLPSLPDGDSQTFDGWYLTENCSGNKVTKIDNSFRTKEIVLYGKYQDNHQVTLYVDGDVYATRQFYTNAKLPTPTAEDSKVFDGWYLTEDFSGDKLERVPATESTNAPITLYGKFETTT